jgi:hypothetical protein
MILVDMRRLAALPLLFLALAACESSTTVTPRPSPSPSPAAVTPRCHTTDLEATIAQIQGAAGTIYATFEFRNKSAAACDVYGYPGTAMLDAKGSPVPTTAIRTPEYPGHPSGPVLVNLPPGTPALGAADHHGHAVSLFSFNDVTCASSSTNSPFQWQLTPPDETTSLLVPAHRGDSYTSPVCGGKVMVRPMAPPGYVSL